MDNLAALLPCRQVSDARNPVRHLIENLFHLPGTGPRTTELCCSSFLHSRSVQPDMGTYLAQSVEHETLNLRVVGSSLTLGANVNFHV